ncbi:protein kinase, partial [bacterium]|nr:protein kinase [bacterium]
MDDFLADETLDLLEARLEGKRGVFEKIFAVGETIAGRYKVERVVGRGNIGRVYQVLDTGTGKHFAIKTVYPRFSGHPDVGPRLEALARRLSGVRHENVVSVLEYGRDHDLLFLKLPWMKARTLESALEATIPAARTRGIPVKQARQALEHAAKALSAAGFDLPHLDLVPKNMFVSPQGLAVADLGLMHAVLPAIEPDDISVMDFREYLAPEISDARAVSAASDTYTMGKVLYRLVTLRHPGRHVTDVPIVGEYPPAVADLIKFATDDAPGARYAHAGALAEAFDDVLHGGPAPSP